MKNINLSFVVYFLSAFPLILIIRYFEQKTEGSWWTFLIVIIYLTVARLLAGYIARKYEN